LNGAMWAAIPQLMKSLDDHVDVNVIVVRGGGAEAFASGADISEFGETRSDAGAARDYEVLNGAAFHSIRQARKPVIAMIQGHCIGGGLALALACDLRIADTTALFQLPPARLGLAYPLDGLRDLVAAIGAPAAKDLIFTARRIGAEEALRLCLISRLATDIEAESRALCAEISANAPLTIAHAKRAIDIIAERPGQLAPDEISRMAAACFDSDDYAEGWRAFVEKRKPVFRGH
jgi:enoyl-CoA hydratase